MVPNHAVVELMMTSIVNMIRQGMPVRYIGNFLCWLAAPMVIASLVEVPLLAPSDSSESVQAA